MRKSLLLILILLLIVAAAALLFILYLRIASKPSLRSPSTAPNQSLLRATATAHFSESALSSTTIAATDLTGSKFNISMLDQGAAHYRAPIALTSTSTVYTGDMTISISYNYPAQLGGYKTFNHLPTCAEVDLAVASVGLIPSLYLVNDESGYLFNFTPGDFPQKVGVNKFSFSARQFLSDGDFNNPLFTSSTSAKRFRFLYLVLPFNQKEVSTACKRVGMDYGGGGTGSYVDRIDTVLDGNYVVIGYSNPFVLR